MKELLVQFGRYHIWANQLLLEAINQLPEEKCRQEVPSSFNSLYTTVLHIWDAESIWWQRMKLQEHIKIPSHDFEGSFKTLSQQLINQDKLWLEWVSMSSGIRIQKEKVLNNPFTRWSCIYLIMVPITGGNWLPYSGSLER